MLFAALNVSYFEMHMEVTAAGLSSSLRWKEVCIVSVCTSSSRLINLPAGRREGGRGRGVEGGGRERG